jgi:hypothetical protein
LRWSNLLVGAVTDPTTEQPLPDRSA